MRLRHLMLAMLLVVPFGACAREGGEKLNVTAVDYGFTGVPRTIKGGVIDLTFTNLGEADHEVAFLKTDGATIDEVKKGFAPVLEGGPFPAFLTGGTVPGEIPPDQTLRSRFTLPAGEYMLFCALQDTPGDDETAKPGKSHYELGMIQEVTVEGDDEAAEITTPGGTFTAQDYTFVTPEGVRSGKRDYVFRNGSPKQWHHMVLSEFDGNVTPDKP